MHSDGDMNAAVNKRTRCGCNNIITRGRCQGYYIQHDCSASYMLYRMETVPLTSSYVKKLEVAEDY